MTVPAPDGYRALSVSPEAFTAACRADLQFARDEAARLRAMPVPRDPAKVLDAFDNTFLRLNDAGSRASLARNVHPDKPVREAAEACEQEVEALSAELTQDRGIYDALAGVDRGALDPASRWYVEKSLRDFRRAGVDRDEATRRRVRELREELVKTGQEFGRNVKDDVKKLALEPARLDGLPDDWKRARPPGADGKVVVSTDNTDYVPFVTYAKDGKAREELWRLYRLRGHPKNLEVLSRMLTLRAEMAKLLGYPTWAQYITEDKMIGSEKNAAGFVERIAQASGARMEREYAQLLERKRRDDPRAARVDAWDSAFLQERVKNEQYGFDAQSIRPYFEYTKVKRGVMDIAGRMFGLSWRRADVPLWTGEAEAWDVLETAPGGGAGRLLGRIYFDMFPREGKYKHYAQYTLANGREGRQLPEGVLVCNFPRPGAEPALMEYNDVRTFFHEFGHLMHHVLGGHTRWGGIGGISTEWDFVEAPSQMFEEWTWDPAILRTFAKHWQTGEPVPEELVRRARAADEYGKGLWVRQQMFYAATSLELHRRDPEGLDSTALVNELQEKYTPFPHVEGTYFHESFGHLDGYSAIYYTYMWSLVIAKDMFTVFEKEGLLDPAAALRYRREVLEQGGSKPAADAVRSFLGRPYGFDAYEAWLNRG